MKKITFSLLLSLLCSASFAQFTVSITANMPTSCNDSDIVLTATPSGGFPPYTYIWKELIWSPTTIVATGAVASGLGSGYYMVTAFDANNDSAFMYFNVQPTVMFYGYGQPAVCPLSNGKVFINIYGTGTPPYSIAYSNGVTHSGILGPLDSLLGLPSGIYQAFITDAAGCFTAGNGQSTSQDSGIIVSQTSNILANMTTTASNCADGTANVAPTGGTAPYTYIWSSNPPQYGATATGLAPSTMGYIYNTISDADGCTAQNYVYIPTGPNFITGTTTATPSNCFDGTATAIATLGTAPYTYSWNTNPAQTTQTISGLSPNSYPQATITDAQGCFVRLYANIPAGPNYLQSNATSIPETCIQSNGSIAVTASGGTQPYTYLWNTGATTAAISGLQSGYYSLTITDITGCALTVYKHVGQVSPVYAYVSTNATSCSDNDGSATVTISGGTAPYAIQWSNGATTASISNLNSGYYSAYVTDANGCTASDWSSLAYPHNTCDVFISGNVFDDLNADCVFNYGEYGTNYALLNVSPSVGYVSTNANGYYSFYAAPGTYNITPYPVQFRTLLCPVSGNITVNATTAGTSYTGNNFYENVDSLFFNLGASVSCGVARPGFFQTIYVAYSNTGTTVQNANLTLTHDPAVTFVSCGIAGSYNLSTHSYDAPLQLYPNTGNNWTPVTLYVPATLPIGTSLHNYVSISPSAGDVWVANNADSCSIFVTGSYDPNIKSVVPKGIAEQGFITTLDTTLKYTIEFQNTGNDTAFTVVIKDTLDSNLDIPSFRLGAASHGVTYAIDGIGVVTFTFNNILLPDSTRDEENSHGQVSYFIKQKPNLPEATEIKNTAYIYFDYNTAIITNTTLNTIYEPVGINAAGTKVGILPNPASDGTDISLTNQILSTNASLQLYTVTGNELKTGFKQQNLNGKIHLSNIGLTDGIYFIKISDHGNLVGNGKIVFRK